MHHNSKVKGMYNFCMYVYILIYVFCKYVDTYTYVNVYTHLLWKEGVEKNFFSGLRVNVFLKLDHYQKHSVTDQTKPSCVSLLALLHSDNK